MQKTKSENKNKIYQRVIYKKNTLYVRDVLVSTNTKIVRKFTSDSFFSFFFLLKLSFSFSSLYSRHQNAI